MATTDECSGPVDDPFELPLEPWLDHLWAFLTLR